MEMYFYYMDKKRKIHRTTSFEIWRQNVPNSLHLETIVGKVRVSTIFFGMDSSYFYRITERPYLFETVIFKGRKSEKVGRYTTMEEAVKGHRKIVRELTKLHKTREKK